MVLQPARVERDRTIGLAEPMRGLFNAFHWHAGFYARHLRIEEAHGFGERLKTSGVSSDEFLILQAIAKNDVKNRHQQNQVGTGAHRKIEVRVARNGRHARIDHDQLAAVVAAFPEVAGGDGITFTHIGADHHHYLRFGNVAPGQRAAIHTEYLLVGDSGGHRAQTSVVVDVTSSDGKPCELAHEVGFFGDERRAPEYRYGILSVLRLDVLNALDGKGERLFPGGLPESLLGPHQGVEQTVLMIRLQIALDAFGTELAKIEWEFLPRFKSNHLVVANLQLYTALLSAKAANAFSQACQPDAWIRPAIRWAERS
jgi:hypothetical protein